MEDHGWYVAPIEPPDSCATVIARRRQARARAIPRHVEQWSMMAIERFELLPRDRVPEVDASIGSTGREALSVGAERDSLNVPGLLHHQQLPSGRTVPDSRRAIEAAGDNVPSIGGEFTSDHDAVVA